MLLLNLFEVHLREGTKVQKFFKEEEEPPLIRKKFVSRLGPFKNPALVFLLMLWRKKRMGTSPSSSAIMWMHLDRQATEEKGGREIEALSTSPPPPHPSSLINLAFPQLSHAPNFPSKERSIMNEYFSNKG